VEPAEYDYMFELEDSLWWYVGQRRITEVLLRRNVPDYARTLQVLDAGCGTGGALKQLERFGHVTAFDFAPKAAELYLTRQKGRIAVASTDAIPFADASFDLVTSFDVLSQIDTVDTALQELGRVLRPGGTLFVRVPAFQALHGPHDVTLHTKHRFSAPELAARINKAGLRTVETTYANTLLFPVAVVRRLLAKLTGIGKDESDVRAVPAPLNTALEVVLAAEAMAIRRFRLPFGLSVVALARKPARP
jgi:SAM-dependent methyltransferase